MKKSLSALLAATLVFSSFASIASAADAELTAQQKFEALKEKGIFAGINGEAALDQKMNRAQFARVAALILGLEGIGNPDTKVVTEKPFSDVALNAWYTEEIAAAKEAGVFEGNGDGTFNPTSDFTVQQLAVVTAKLLNLKPVADAKVDGAAAWAAGSIQALKDAGVDFPTNYTEAATREQLVNVSFVANAKINGEAGEQAIASFKAVGAKKLEVTLAKAKSNETITVKRGNITINGTWTWDAANKVGTLTTPANLVEGDYTITVGELTASAKVEKAKLTKLEITSDVLARTTVTADTYYNEASFNYSATNQYGEKVTNHSITWSFSVASTPANGTDDKTNGKVRINTANDVLKDDVNVVVTGISVVDGVSVSASKTLKVSKRAVVSDIKLTQVYNKDNKTLYVSNNDADNKFYILMEGTDQYGNAVTPAMINSDVTFIDGSANVDYAAAEEIEIDGKKVLAKQITTHTAHATYMLTAALAHNGKSANIQFTVAEDAKVKTITLSSPADRVSAGKTVYVPFTAVDQYGAEVKKYDDIQAQINLTGQANAVFTKEKDPITGDLKLKLNVEDDYNTDLPLLISASVVGSQGNLTLTVEKEAVPAIITGIKDATVLFEKGAGASATFNKDNIVVKDQYGNDIGLGNYGAADADAYTVEVVSENGNVTVTGGTDVTSAAGVTLNGSATNGSSKITLKLQKGGVDVEGGTFEFTAKTIEKKEIVDFAVKSVGTVHGPDAAANPNYNVGLELNGLTSDGSKVALTNASIQGITTTSGNLNVTSETVTAAVYGVGNNDSDSSDSFDAGLTVVFVGENGAVVKSQTVKVNEATPAAESIVVAGSGAKGEYVEVGFGSLNTLDTRTSSTFKFEVTDQYGKKGQVNPTTFYVTNQSTGLNITINNATGVVSTNGVLSASDVGKSFVVTAITANGKSVSTKVVIGN